MFNTASLFLISHTYINMKNFSFGDHSFPLLFHINEDNQILLYDLKRIGASNELDAINIQNYSFIVDINISGNPTYISVGDRKIFSSESFTLRYVNHEILSNDKENHLIITQENKDVRVKSHYVEDLISHTLTTYSEVTNINNKEIILESVSSFAYYALTKVNSYNKTFLYVPHNYWYKEGGFKKLSLEELGLSHPQELKTFNKLKITNQGTFSTKNYLPLGIIQEKDQVIMFEIYSNSNWEYELGDFASSISLHLNGDNLISHNFIKRLQPNETFVSVFCSITKSKTINAAIKNLTIKRRSLLKTQNSGCPVIFNEYMLASWNKPTEQTAKEYGPIAKELGAEYYVIDCGWHDEEENPFYHIGKWEESKTNYPHGLEATLNYLRSLGLKVGLWIEPEPVGYFCELAKNMDKDMFFQHFHQPHIVSHRYQLDFSNPKAYDFAFNNVCKIIDKYHLDYVKIDYNIESSPGTDSHGRLFGEGLNDHSRKVLEFYSKLKEKYPHVIFEGCASGGNRLDYATLSLFDICSLSDQTDFDKYPCIISNIYAGVLPEQGAIWACPINLSNNQTDEEVVISMANTMLGRIHLGSRINLLKDNQKELVKEGIEVYKSYSSLINQSYPYQIKGFASEYDKAFIQALSLPDYDLINVITLKGNIPVNFSLNKPIKSIEVIYPSHSKTNIIFNKNKVNVEPEDFPRARILKVIYE